MRCISGSMPHFLSHLGTSQCCDFDEPGVSFEHRHWRRTCQFLQSHFKHFHGREVHGDSLKQQNKKTTAILSVGWWMLMADRLPKWFVWKMARGTTMSCDSHWLPAWIPAQHSWKMNLWILMYTSSTQAQLPKARNSGWLSIAYVVYTIRILTVHCYWSEEWARHFMHVPSTGLPKSSHHKHQTPLAYPNEASSCQWKGFSGIGSSHSSNIGWSVGLSETSYQTHPPKLGRCSITKLPPGSQSCFFKPWGWGTMLFPSPQRQ